MGVGCVCKSFKNILSNDKKIAPWTWYKISEGIKSNLLKDDWHRSSTLVCTRTCKLEFVDKYFLYIFRDLDFLSSGELHDLKLSIAYHNNMRLTFTVSDFLINHD